ncbi:uncharacterized protein LOC133824433 [Humulus lupulus]|uniref:uncharacterized protein LOC133824433 n=1 Tax=Humulus lupulus TaxID=3486 RepID=UPI002B416343|nr:uncharacterized protein LOC133824433 [Humulus lupulus]
MIDDPTQKVIFEEKVSNKEKELSGSKVTKNLEKHPEISIDHHIKIPFLQRLRKNKLYKQKGNSYETVALIEECNAILQKKLPPKLKDPSSFTIPCTTENVVFDKELCDLGESVNLIPLFIYRKLKLGEAKPTNVALQMEDPSVKHPRGIIEDVLVKVDKFIFPANFIILYMDEDTNIPIILGRLLLAIGRALIDVQKGELKLRVQKEKTTHHRVKMISSGKARLLHEWWRVPKICNIKKRAFTHDTMALKDLRGNLDPS